MLMEEGTAWMALVQTEKTALTHRPSASSLQIESFYF
jgi:hypothetical protein